MKIAHLAPHWTPILEHRLVGIKRIIYNLYEEQRRRGHDVYIIAPRGSVISDSSKLITTISPLQEWNIHSADPKSLFYGIVHASIAAKKSHEFDVIHNHAEQVFLPFISVLKTPVVSTIHGASFNQEQSFIFKSFKDSFFSVAISKKSEELNKDVISFNAQVYNGVSLLNWPLNLEADEYMLSVGRINPVKGTLTAINLANKLSRKLIIAGIKELNQESYYEEVVKEDKNSKNVEFMGEVFEPNEKYTLFSKARLFLFPVAYEETFASTPLEAMAAGTPVVAFARGSVPEQIKDGVTGFIINPSEDDKRGDYVVRKTGIEGLAEAIEMIYGMDKAEYQKMRSSSRKHVEENFTVEKMVDGYEAVYRKILGE